MTANTERDIFVHAHQLDSDAERETYHIAKIFDGGATETGRPYFVMELVRGVPITEYCDQNRLGSRERLELFIEACEAVQHAHQKGIIHRDLKPSNILVTLHDGKAVPKVIDFGIAKATRSRLTEKTLFTRFQSFVGTPAYMSPEQAHMGSQDIDTRTDIYALGALLYELLTGRTPFEPKELTSFEECRRTIMEKEPTRPSSRVSTLIGEERTMTAKRRRTEPGQLIRLLRSDLDWITMKCLEKDRTRRYETSSALAQDIRRYLDGDTVVARPPSTSYRLQKLVRRHKVVVVIASVVLLAAIVSTWQAVRATLAVREQNRLRGDVETALKQEEEQRRRAEEGEATASRRAYSSDMTLAQLALSTNNYGRVVGLLDRYRPSDGRPDLRRWEWRYFWNQVRSEAEFALPRQPDAIAGLALSSDSRVLASIDFNKTLKLWDVNARKALLEHQESGLDPRAIAFSHDGTRLATVVRQRTSSAVKVWNVGERRVTCEFDCPTSIRELAFTIDDEGLLLLGHDLSVARWNFAGQQFEIVLPAAQSAPGRAAGPATFSANRQRVAFLEGTRIRVHDLTTGEQVADLEGFREGTWSLALSPDGKLLAAGPTSAATSTDIKLFSVDSGNELDPLTGHVSWVPAIAFTADGKRLVSAGGDQTVRIWNVDEGRETAVLHGHLTEIYRVVVSTDGKRIFSGCKDGTILGWDANRIRRRSRFETLPKSVTELVFLPGDREMLTVDAEGRVELWDSQSLQTIESLDMLGSKVKQLLVSSDGSRVFAETTRGEVKVLDWPTRQVIRTLKEDSGRRLEIAGLIQGDQYLIVRAARSTVRLVDTTSWETGDQWQFDGGNTWVGSRLGISAKMKILAASGFRGPSHYLNLATGQSGSFGDDQSWTASDLAFSPDGRLLATSSLEGSIRLWDASNFELIDELRGHLIGVERLTFSPDGMRLATASQGKEAVKLWDVVSRQEVATLPGEGLIKGRLSFSPDGNMLVAINAQGKAHIWRAPSFDDIAAIESQPE